MKIAIATIFYNSNKELFRLLESIPPNVVDYFIGVDGIFKFTKEAYPDMPDLSASIDRLGLMLYAGDIKKCITILVDKPNSTEFEKRNAYLEECEQLQDVDALLIIDSDEFFTYEPGTKPEDSWNTFKNNLELAIKKTAGEHNVFGIRTYDPITKVDSYCARVWYKPHEMRYTNGSHYHYANIIREKDTIEQFRNNKINYQQQAHCIIKGLTLGHDHSLRTKEYLDQRSVYQRYLVRYEELVQSYRFDHDTCHEMAKQNPKNDFDPTK